VSKSCRNLRRYAFSEIPQRNAENWITKHFGPLLHKRAMSTCQTFLRKAK